MTRFQFDWEALSRDADFVAVVPSSGWMADGTSRMDGLQWHPRPSDTSLPDLSLAHRRFRTRLGQASCMPRRTRKNPTRQLKQRKPSASQRRNIRQLQLDILAQHLPLKAGKLED